jgi:uncharacterized protein YprB with RNaseH-like and TPR domain
MTLARIGGSALLRSTFRHIHGVGPQTEQLLWDAGLYDWQSALSADSVPLSEVRRQRLGRALHESVARLAAGDALHFSDALPSSEQWRIFPEFRDAVAYVDIETTGLGSPGDYITTIALYDGHAVQTYVQGHNLRDFARDIQHYGLLVTYNGRSFDVPFIRSDLGIVMRHAHIDLRYILASLGYRGGLKRCEVRLGIDRGDLVDVDGFFAVLLWRDYQRNRNGRALETLLAYNVLDVINLETLMVLAYNMKLEGTPFEETHRLPLPVQPANPFRADLRTIYRIREAHTRSPW